MSISPDFWNKLGEKYNNKGAAEQFEQERQTLEALLPQVEEKIANRYTFGEPVAIGGAGLVFTVMDENLQTVRALKFARPIEGRQPILTKIIAGERYHVCVRRRIQT